MYTLSIITYSLGAKNLNTNYEFVKTIILIYINILI